MGNCVKCIDLFNLEFVVLVVHHALAPPDDAGAGGGGTGAQESAPVNVAMKRRRKNNAAAMAHRVEAGFVLAILLGLASSSAVAQGVDGDSAPGTCSFDPPSRLLSCSARTLNSPDAPEELSSSSSSPSAQSAASISVRCEDLFFFESHLRANHFGYLPGLRRLRLDSCKIRRVPALAFSGLPGLRSLSLTSRNSEWPAMSMTLEQDALTGLGELRALNLSRNNLWSLPRGALCGLQSLVALNLSRNSLQETEDLGFSSPPTSGACSLPVESLDLSHNSLVRLPRGAFGQLDRLSHLDLSMNSLDNLEDAALSGLSSLRRLDLSGNRLVALPPALFQDAPLLQELYLQNNSLSALAPGLFSPLKKLLVLNLSRNALGNEWVDSDTFSSLAELVALDLSHNDITRVDQGLFRGLGRLQILDLRHNRILAVSPRAFLGQRSLHVLYLSHNEIASLHAKSLVGLTSLSSLSLDHNALAALHRNALKNCTNLQDLALHSNRLTEVPKAVRSVPLLRTLDLGDNEISGLRAGNESFAGLRHLYGLRLEGNGLSSLPAGLFDTTPALQVLNLAHNNLPSLDQAAFNSLRQLRMLRLDGNRLEDINGLLTAQSELRWLNLSDNALQWFDYASVPRTVRWLDLRRNRLEELANYFSLREGFSLATLDASENRLTRLTPLSLPDSVEEVVLAANELEALEAGAFAGKTRLRRVDLTNNRLRTVALAALASEPQGEGKNEHEEETYFLSRS